MTFRLLKNGSWDTKTRQEALSDANPDKKQKTLLQGVCFEILAFSLKDFVTNRK
jgi:hypothetical protein